MKLATPLADRIEFTVYGEAAPQGSKVRNRFGGMRESSNKVQPWRDKVSQEAGETMAGRALLAGPLEVHLTFFLKRPKSQYGTGRNAELLKPGAPVFVEKSPDIDKCCRAVLDALTGVCYRDDAQVAVLVAEKRYGAPAHVQVSVREAGSRAIGDAA